MEYVATCLQQHCDKEDVTMPSTEQIAFRTLRAAGRWMMRKLLEMKNVIEMAVAGWTGQQKRA